LPVPRLGLWVSTPAAVRTGGGYGARGLVACASILALLDQRLTSQGLMAYTIDGVTFPTKKAVLAECSRILKNTRVGAEVKDPADHRFLLGVLGLHRQAKAKIGCGVARFRRLATGFGPGATGFWAERVDGSTTDWSFHAAVNPPSPAKEALTGLRHAVIDQVLDFRRRAFAESAVIQCAITGAPIRDSGSHADHVRPFRELVDDFCREWGVPLDQIEVDPTRDGETLTVISDPELREAWVQFHLERAELRMVSASANLSRGRK
jgi:hypothetical protein